MPAAITLAGSIVRAATTQPVTAPIMMYQVPGSHSDAAHAASPADVHGTRSNRPRQLPTSIAAKMLAKAKSSPGLVGRDLVREVVPEHAFQMELEELELDDDILRALGRVANVGELMMRMLSDEAGLQAMLRQGGPRGCPMQGGDRGLGR